jgi:protein-S-isoprenylcysteine O-methyltransferase Ste14
MGQTEMQQNSVLRHILGYALGAAFFIILIPYALWYLSSLDYPVFNIPIVPIDNVNLIIAPPILIIGVVYVVWSNIYLLSKGKGGPTDFRGVSVSPRTQLLVRNGPYKHSRNPMVFGTNALYLSIVIYLNSLGCLIVLAIFFLLIVKYVVAEEEKRLLRDFGDDYLHYKEKTSMIIPLPARINRRAL